MDTSKDQIRNAIREAKKERYPGQDNEHEAGLPSEGYTPRKPEPFIKGVHDWQNCGTRSGVCQWLNDNKVECDDVTAITLDRDGNFVIFYVKWIPVSSTT